MTNQPSPHPYDLDAYCAWLNRLRWVGASGQPYRVIKPDDKPREIVR